MRFALPILLFIFPTFVLAQIAPIGASSLSLSLSPQNPRPNETVFVAPQSSLINLANSMMVLSVNGESVYSGPTKANQVTLSGNGRTTTISVSITANGTVYRQSISLKPGDVALVLEPAAYTPALYKGRSLVPENGSVRVVAIADLRTSPTNRLDPDTLSYSWTVGDVTNANASGIGKSSIVLPAPLTYRSQDVSVVVQSRDGTLVGSDSVRISSVRPTLRLYITDPLQGPLYDNAISGSHTLQGSETTFTAVPYSFSLTQGVPVIRWFLNGASVREGASITLRSEGAGRGRASLSASSGSGSDTITAGLSLIFGENSSGFFGL